MQILLLLSNANTQLYLQNVFALGKYVFHDYFEKHAAIEKMFPIRDL